MNNSQSSQLTTTGVNDTTFKIEAPCSEFCRAKLEADQRNYDDRLRDEFNQMLSRGNAHLEEMNTIAAQRRDAQRRADEELKEQARLSAVEEEELRLLYIEIAKADAEKAELEKLQEKAEADLAVQRKRNAEKMKKLDRELIKAQAENAKMDKKLAKVLAEAEALDKKCEDIGFKFGMATLSDSNDSNRSHDEERKKGDVVLTFSKLDPLNPAREFLLYFSKYEFTPPHDFTPSGASPNFPEFKKIASEAKSVKEFVALARECWLKQIEVQKP